MARSVVYALKSFATVINGAPYSVAKDQPMFADDPVVKAYPADFGELPEQLRAQVAREPASPDEKRTPRRTKKT